ncbi:MAG: Metal-dependent hydrolase [Rhodobacteraceae bacterium HLUCCO18]|nr:MAG: Metal-dependent hydrolase [Rhodobacteraceae bacterium HLUCCO18]
MDHDAGLAALTALREALRDRGADYAHLFAAAPNSGRPTGIDLDGDGRTWRARDAHGYGLFSGDGGMALLSRFPIGGVRDFTGLPWVALPGNAAEGVTPAAALPILRLHSVGAWDVEVLTPAGTLNLLASHASAPVFDGPEDRNGLRNADELLFWVQYLGGWTPEGSSLSAERFVVMGTFNIDPERGEGRREGLAALRTHARLQDPEPRRPDGGMVTADWPEDGPGQLRVDYLLPSRTLAVTDSGILWPGDAPLLGISAGTASAASDHRLVWIDLAF